MSFIFAGESGNGLRFRFGKITTAEINATSDITDAIMLMRVAQPLKISLFDNGMDVDLGFAFVHPKRDPDDVSARLMAFELPANRPLNFDISGSTGLTFDVGMWIYVWKLAGSASSGAFRYISWS